MFNTRVAKKFPIKQYTHTNESLISPWLKDEWRWRDRNRKKNRKKNLTWLLSNIWHAHCSMPYKSLDSAQTQTRIAAAAIQIVHERRASRMFWFLSFSFSIRSFVRTFVCTASTANSRERKRDIFIRTLIVAHSQQIVGCKFIYYQNEEDQKMNWNLSQSAANCRFEVSLHQIRLTHLECEIDSVGAAQYKLTVRRFDNIVNGMEIIHSPIRPLSLPSPQKEKQKPTFT